jgi:hypothetical protein
MNISPNRNDKYLDNYSKSVLKFIFPCLKLDSGNEDSGKMLRHLELIDDEALEYGVKMVKLDDPLMAKKYGHREPPGLGYFRKGNYIKYDGKKFMQNALKVLI